MPTISKSTPPAILRQPAPGVALFGARGAIVRAVAPGRLALAGLAFAAPMVVGLVTVTSAAAQPSNESAAGTDPAIAPAEGPDVPDLAAHPAAVPEPGGEGPASLETPETSAGPPPTTPAVSPVGSAPGPAPIAAPLSANGTDQAFDGEQAGPSQAPEEPNAEPLGQGTRLFLSVQSNTPVGEIEEDASRGFDLSRATLVGVTDAMVGVRFGRLSAGLGLVWTQVITPQVQFNSCTSGFTEVDDSRTLFGLLPTIRGDILVADGGRARLEAGLSIPLLIASRERESLSGRCTGETITVDETADGVYGLNALVGGRYHVWPALSVGAEVGLSYLFFDVDEDPDTDYDDPTSTTMTVYSALVLAIELPL